MGYAIIILSLIFSTTMYSMTFFAICMKASRNLHNAMFHKLIRAESRFFDTHPSGRILNRFSKDIGSIDEVLPMTLFEMKRMLWQIIGVFTIATYVSPYVGIATLCMAIIFYFFGRFYLKTSRHGLMF